MNVLRRGIPKLRLCAGCSQSSPVHKSESAIQTWPDLYGEVFAHCYRQGGRYWIDLPEVSSFAFSTSDDEVTAFFPSRVPVAVVRESYWRSVLPLVLQARGAEVLHASGVVTGRGVVALCGKSCSGKSTAAYGLSQRGYRLWADDAVAFETGDPILTTSLPFSIRLRPRSQAFFAPQRPARRDGFSEVKAREEDSEPLSAIYILEPVSSGMWVETSSLSEAEAFTALLSHAYCFSLHERERKRQMMRRYFDLSVKVPVFKVRYRPDMQRISSVLDSIESGISALCQESKVLVSQS